MNKQKKDIYQHKHFIQCINDNCKIYHLVSISDIQIIREEITILEFFLCESCRRKKEFEHTIQCINCKTVLDFLPTLGDESPTLIYVEKCSNCGGSIEDEINLIGIPFKELYV